jgi:hypothetical protein
MAAEVLQFLQRRGGGEQADTGETGEMHEISC